MDLETSIKQSKFKSQRQKAILNLIYTCGRINSVQTKFFKNYDLSPQQYNVLRILRGQYPNKASLGLVQERMLDQNSNASRLVDKLFQKNLVERNESKRDRRQIELLLTKQGLDLLAQIDLEIENMENEFNTLSEEEFLQLNKLIDKLNQ